ncbi:MAG: hypothetical protein OEY97_03750 [Nitrospirota bacterium]|nr:hypothetical protein [Nitrospirota bacterium]
MRGTVRNRLLAALFLGILAAPLAALPGGSGNDLADMETAEKRRMAAFPPRPHSVAELNAFPGRFGDWFGDHMGLRRTLVQTHNRVRLLGLGTSPSPQAVVGRDGWHFYAHEAAMRGYRRQFPFTTEQLIRWQHTLEARRDWLAERGIQYLFVVVPDKATVYGEFMPARITRQDNPTRLDQFLAHMAAHSSVPVLDLRPALLAAKGGDTPLYRKTDSHWNEYGGFVGYRELMRRVGAMVGAPPPHALTDFRVATETVPGGGLAGLYDLNASLTEPVPRLTPNFAPCPPARPVAFEGDFTWYTGRGPLRTRCDREGLPRAVFFRDSFADALLPFVGDHFAEAVYIVNPFMREIMEQILAGRNMAQAPDLVIEQVVQRKLYMLEPETDPQVRQAMLRRRFQQDGTQLVAISRPQGWPVRATREGQVFALPPARAGDGNWPVLHLTVHSPQAATLEVAFQTGAGNAPWIPVGEPLAAGRNDLYFGLPLIGFDGRLALVPPVLPEPLVISGLEVRAVPLDTRR